MRDVYWKHIMESKERIAKENPSMSKYEALGKARDEYNSQPTRDQMIHSIVMCVASHCD